MEGMQTLSVTDLGYSKLRSSHPDLDRTKVLKIERMQTLSVTGLEYSKLRSAHTDWDRTRVLQMSKP